MEYMSRSDLGLNINMASIGPGLYICNTLLATIRVWLAVLSVSTTNIDLVWIVDLSVSATMEYMARGDLGLNIVFLW
jgi:hypothetical protein